MINPHKAKFVYAAILLIAILWNLAVVAAPWTWARGHPGIASMLYFMFSPICHQRADRSFVWMGHRLAVCHRCAGIYLGALVGLLIFPLLSSLFRSGEKGRDTRLPGRAALLVALALVAADAGLELLGVRSSTPMSRFLTGGFCGIVAPFYLLPSIFEIFAKPKGSLSSTVIQDIQESEKPQRKFLK
jgi:uncharacterized membrane protein